MAFRHIFSIVGLILIVIITLSAVKKKKNYTQLKYNVSNDNHFIPLHYDVKIKFDVNKNVFFGKCNIDIRIKRSTKSITIKSSRTFGIIKIDLFTLIFNNTEITSKKFPITVDIQKFINGTYIHLGFTQSSINDFLLPGIYILKMVYVHTLNDGDFSESYYTNKEEM